MLSPSLPLFIFCLMGLWKCFLYSCHHFSCIWVENQVFYIHCLIWIPCWLSLAQDKLHSGSKTKQQMSCLSWSESAKQLILLPKVQQTLVYLFFFFISHLESICTGFVNNSQMLTLTECIICNFIWNKSLQNSTAVILKYTVIFLNFQQNISFLSLLEFGCWPLKFLYEKKKRLCVIYCHKN